jgi:hypothetical protein
MYASISTRRRERSLERARDRRPGAEPTVIAVKVAESSAARPPAFTTSAHIDSAISGAPMAERTHPAELLEVNKRLRR